MRRWGLPAPPHPEALPESRDSAETRSCDKTRNKAPIATRKDPLPVSVPKFSVAPMMDWSDRFCRSLHRVLSRRARLYTEMVTTGAVLHGPRERLLGFDAEEHYVAVQLGGSDPD